MSRRVNTSEGRKGAAKSGRKTARKVDPVLASEQISTALDNPAERAYSALVSAFHDATAVVVALSTHGALLQEEKASFYTLAKACIITGTRFDRAWTRVVDHFPLDELKLHQDLAVEAKVAMTLANEQPKMANLFHGHAKASFAEDQISAMLDRAMDGPVRSVGTA